MASAVFLEVHRDGACSAHEGGVGRETRWILPQWTLCSGWHPFDNGTGQPTPSPTPLSGKSYGTGLKLVLFQNETRATEPAENSLGLILAQLLPHHGSLPLLALNKAGPVHFVLALWFLHLQSHLPSHATWA